MPVEQLVTLLRQPEYAQLIAEAEWTDILCVARAETLLGTLAERLHDQPVPEGVMRIFGDARLDSEMVHRKAFWEAQCAMDALAPLGIKPILLKGAAYLAAGLDAASGRNIGDLDILVPRDALDAAEAALLAAGWEWVKEDPYDQQYYRRWMHELPPLIHKDRDAMIDVHHTILPLTARPKPHPEYLINDAHDLESGLRVLSPTARVVHAAAHLIADGDMAGGLRNLWDIDRLVREGMMTDSEFHLSLTEDARVHGLAEPVNRALRLANALYGTPLVEYSSPALVSYEKNRIDWFFVRRLYARNSWGQETRPFTRLAFYIRSHLLRMPPLMLARHLWIKWRRGADHSA